MLVAFDWGTLPSWLLLLAAFAAAWSFRRAGGGTAIDSLETSGRVLEKRVHEQDKTIAQLRAELAEQRGKTDFAIALAPVLNWTEGHELRAQERHEAMVAMGGKQLTILELIAERLGPDPDGGAA